MLYNNKNGNATQDCPIIVVSEYVHVLGPTFIHPKHLNATI